MVFSMGFFIPSPVKGGEEKLLITNVNIIDVKSGDIKKNVSIWIKDDQIVKIGNSNSKTPIQSHKDVDGKGGFIIPGLWDLHAHLVITGPEYGLPMYLKYGVLGIRDMGWGPELDPIILRDKINSDKILGPKMFVAGPILDGDTNDYPYRIRLSTPEDVVPTLKKLKSIGVDFIKVHASLPKNIYLKIAKEVKLLGLRFEGHVPRSITAAEASDAGQSTLEHMIMDWCQFTEVKDENGEIKDQCNDQKVLNLIDKLKKNGTWLVPTMSVYHSGFDTIVTNSSSFQKLIDEADSRTGKHPINQQTIEGWKLQYEVSKQFSPPEDQLKTLTKNQWYLMKKMLKLVSDSGVKIMTGTDSGYLGVYPGISTHIEMEVMVEAGVTPLKALQSATINPIEYFGLENEMGSITAGMKANFLLLEKNPLLNISNTQTIKAIILNGKISAPEDHIVDIN